MQPQEITKEFIQENLLRKDGNLNFYKLRDFKITQTKEELYLIYNEIEQPICRNENCNNKTKFNSFKTGFTMFCSNSCLNSSEYMKEKVRDSYKDKDKLKERRKKCTETRLKKNNGKYSSETQLEKTRQTNLQRYGKEKYTNPEKRKETRIKNNDGVFWSDEQKKKSKKTKLEKYGDENYNNIEKGKHTKLEKYGDENYNNSSKSSFSRRNNNYPHWNTETKKYIKNLLNKVEFIDVDSLCKRFFISESEIYILVRETHNQHKLRGRSQNEIHVYNFIESKDKILNYKKLGKEIDIFVQSAKFGIEYNGLFWHSYNPYKFPHDKVENSIEDKNKHLDKTELCEQKGIQLFHIFENEWLDPVKQEIWKSVINSKLGLHKRIYARKTEIRMVQNKEKDMFLDNNHLQGSCSSSINIGLYYKNELVSIMTFGKSRFSKKYEYELLRFASKLYTTVIGGGSKLIKFFEDTYKPSSLISYANRRWSTGNFYEQVEFTFEHNSSPNYFYFKDSPLLESRNKYQKHKLSKVLDIFDENKSESENMFLNGYRRIYDSGNKIYIKMYIKV